MTKQSIHDFTHEEKQAALEEAYNIMNPEEELNKIERYVNDRFNQNITPILKSDELEFLFTLAWKALEKSDG